jgi:hypothetical protein
MLSQSSYIAPNITEGGERSVSLSADEAATWARRLSLAELQSISVATGAYNAFAARQKMADHLRQLGVNAGTIAVLSRQITAAIARQDELQLYDYQEIHFVNMAAWQYVVECGFPVNISADAIAVHVQNRGLDFDVEVYKNLPMDNRQATTNLWEKRTDQSVAIQLHLVIALAASTVSILSGQQGAFSDSDPTWFATRADEFTVLLEKVRLRIRNQSGFVPHVHLTFNRFHEACHLARLTYGKTNHEKFLKIARGEIPHDPFIMKSVNRKIDEKYSTLCGFLSNGGYLPSLSADYAFDGARFLHGHPFAAEGGGGVHTLLLDLILSKVAFDYVEGGEAPCFGWCGKSPSVLRQGMLSSVKSIHNIYGVFDAISEGQTACTLLKRLSLSGNYLTLRDCVSLRNLLQRAQLEHLNLSGITVESNDCWNEVAGAIYACKGLLTVNLSLLTASDEVMANLLSALQGSAFTLTEVECDGTEKARGTAGSLCTDPVSQIMSFPNVISLSFEYQGLEPQLVAFATKKALNNRSLVRMSFLHNEHVELHEGEECCLGICLCCLPSWCPCCWNSQQHPVHDRPSDTVLREIDEITWGNRRLMAQTRFFETVIVMLRKYRNCHKNAVEMKQLDVALKRKLLADAVRHEEELRHRKQLELRAASAPRTNILSAVNVTPGQNVLSDEQLPERQPDRPAERPEAHCEEVTDPL